MRRRGRIQNRKLSTAKHERFEMANKREKIEKTDGILYRTL